jgi:hypothetical protein
MTSVSFENTPASCEETPTPQQLFALAGLAIRSARRQRLLKHGRYHGNSHFMRVNPIETVYLDGPNSELTGYEQRLVGHIRRIHPSRDYPARRWSFKLSSSLWAMHHSSVDLKGVASVYSFEWSNDSTLRAERCVKPLPSVDKRDVIDILDNFHIPDDAVGIEEVATEMRQVSSADCLDLQQDIAEFCRRSDLIGVSAQDRRMW